LATDAIEWEALVAWNSVKSTLEKVEGTYDASTVVEEVVSSPIQSEQEEGKKIDNPEKKGEGTPEYAETAGISEEIIKDEEKVTEAVAESEEFRIQPQPFDSSNAIPANFENAASEAQKIRESGPEESPSEENTTLGEESKAAAEDNEEAKPESTSPEVLLPTNDEVQMEASSPASVVESCVPAVKVKKLMEKVYAIFPAAFNFSSPESAEGSIPFITIQPSYLATVTGQDLLLAFDEIMQPYSTGETLSFLSNDVSSSVCPSWLECIQESSDISAPDSATIPLFMLLLSRFEMSILKSFAAAEATVRVSESQRKASSKSIAEATGAKDSDLSPAVAKHESEGQDEKPEESTEDVAAPAGESQKASPASQHEELEAKLPQSLDNVPAENEPSESKHRPIDSMLLNYVVSRAASLSQLETSVDKAVVRRIISFFLDAFLTGSPKFEPDFALEHLLLSPVNFLVQRLPVAGATGEISYSTLNDALALSLKQVLSLSTKKETETSATMLATPSGSFDGPEHAGVKNSGATSDSTSDSEKKNEDDWMHEPATANGSNASTQKKNNKKKKKRKVCYWRRSQILYFKHVLGISVDCWIRSYTLFYKRSTEKENFECRTTCCKPGRSY
jgi:hypothetical protein